MRLRTFQRRKKMGMQDFAIFLGVSEGWLSKYYHGKIVYPSGRLATQIIERLDHKITMEELMSMKGRGEKFNIFA